MARRAGSSPPREGRPLRLFVAVDVPQAVKAGLADVVAPYRERIPRARWTNPSGWHVTLKFLGSTWPRLVDEVRAALTWTASTADPFETELTAIGAFPTARRARVVWAGLKDESERFGEMVNVLDHRLRDHFTAAERVFAPHLTLARLNPPRDIGEFAPDLVGTAVASGPFRVGELVLYRSNLSPRGATYEALARVPLG